MTTPLRTYQGASAEDRIQNRRQLLLDVAFAAMAGEEWRSMSINQLCRLAELNKRYFYESFASLDEIAAAVIEDMSSQLINIAVTTAVEGVQAGLSNIEVARKVLPAVLSYLLDDARRARVLFGEIAGLPLARENRRRVTKTLAQAVSQYGHEHYKAAGKVYPEAELVSSLLMGGTVEALLNWLDGGIAMSREQFMEDMAVLWNLNGDAVVAMVDKPDEVKKSKATKAKKPLR